MKIFGKILMVILIVVPFGRLSAQLTETDPDLPVIQGELQ